MKKILVCIAIIFLPTAISAVNNVHVNSELDIIPTH